MTDRSLLRWIYARRGERLTCELALDDTSLQYDLRTRPGYSPGSIRVEKFADVIQALERHGNLETSLLDEGWTLAHHESLVEGRVSVAERCAHEVGQTFAESAVMERSNEPHPKVRTIRAEGAAVTFVMTIAERDGIARQLVLRCAPDGNIFASIRTATRDSGRDD
jgi:hypothetical protein